MFLYSDQCGGFCVCNIMSRMSGYVLSSKVYDVKCFHNHAWSCSLHVMCFFFLKNCAASVLAILRATCCPKSGTIPVTGTVAVNNQAQFETTDPSSIGSGVLSYRLPPAGTEWYWVSISAPDWSFPGAANWNNLRRPWSTEKYDNFKAFGEHGYMWCLWVYICVHLGSNCQYWFQI